LFGAAAGPLGSSGCFLRSLRCSLIVASIIPDRSWVTGSLGLTVHPSAGELISMGADDFGILVDGCAVSWWSLYSLNSRAQAA
jgi:Cu/Ag efflux pump CusA